MWSRTLFVIGVSLVMAGAVGCEGTPCVDGVRKCSLNDVLICVGGTWSLLKTCESGSSCIEGDCGSSPDISCVSDCSGMICGDDGCGNNCDECAADASCVDGICVCDVCAAGSWECLGTETYRVCEGADGDCGAWGTAQQCEPELLCNAAAKACVSATDCSCEGKECGDDGCGGSCGSCVGSQVCDANGDCICPSVPCAVGEKECVEDTLRICVEDLSGCPQWEDTPCADGCEQSPEPHCVSCTPDCTDKSCGNDGCGGSCGLCAEGLSCLSGVCECVAPECTQDQQTLCVSSGPQGFQVCEAPNGCGHWGPTQYCEQNNTCVDGACFCEPQCENKECGDDKCGGTCGACLGCETCSGGHCVCVANECGPGDTSCQTDTSFQECQMCGTCGTWGTAQECPQYYSCKEFQDPVCVCDPSIMCSLQDYCGDDGCGGQCGGCGAYKHCESGFCVCNQDECQYTGETSCVGNETYQVCNVVDECGAWGPLQTCPGAQDKCIQGGLPICQCQPDCTGKQCGTDGCNGQCPPGCTPPQVCGTGGECECQPASNCSLGEKTCDPSSGASAFKECTDLGAGCSLWGGLQYCQTNYICQGLGECVKDCPSVCASAGKECGSYSGCSCGSCGGNDACQNGQCVCQPESCADQGVECGSTSNGCGQTISCGTCTDSYTECSGGSCDCIDKYTVVDTNFMYGSDAAHIGLKLEMTATSTMKASIKKQTGSFTNAVYIYLRMEGSSKTDDLFSGCGFKGSTTITATGISVDYFQIPGNSNAEFYVQVYSSADDTCSGGGVYESGRVTLHRCQ